jgi:hypothetical protein
MGSRARVQAPDQAPQRPGGTAVVQVKEVVGNLRPATSVVAGEKRVLLADPARAEVSARRAFRARRAAVLLPVVAVHPAAVEEPPAVAAVVVGADAGEQEIEKSKY